MSFMDCEDQIAPWQCIFNNPWEQFIDSSIIAVSMKQTMQQFKAQSHLLTDQYGYIWTMDYTWMAMWQRAKNHVR